MISTHQPVGRAAPKQGTATSVEAKTAPQSFKQRLLEHVKVPKNFPAFYSGWDEAAASAPIPKRFQRYLDHVTTVTDDPPESVELFTRRFENVAVIAAIVQWGRDDTTLLVTSSDQDFLITGELHGTAVGVIEHWSCG